jgi:acetyltransferase-like isoleucine patch superfamily enzyme
MLVETSDIEALRPLNIQCEHFPNARRNRIEIADLAAPCRKLVLSIAGEDNFIRLTGLRVPDGVIRLLGHGAEVQVASRETTNVDLWMYDRSCFSLAEGYSVFGLTAFVHTGTSVVIGRDCLMAEEVQIWTSDFHSIIDLETRAQINFPANVVLEDRVWLARGVHVLKGSHIGKGSIVAARALVLGVVPPRELWGGVPAKRLRSNVSWVASHPADPLHVEALVRTLGEEPSADQPTLKW